MRVYLNKNKLDNTVFLRSRLLFSLLWSHGSSTVDGNQSILITWQPKGLLAFFFGCGVSVISLFYVTSLPSLLAVASSNIPPIVHAIFHLCTIHILTPPPATRSYSSTLIPITSYIHWPPAHSSDPPFPFPSCKLICRGWISVIISDQRHTGV